MKHHLEKLQKAKEDSKGVWIVQQDIVYGKLVSKPGNRFILDISANNKVTVDVPGNSHLSETRMAEDVFLDYDECMKRCSSNSVAA